MSNKQRIVQVTSREDETSIALEAGEAEQCISAWLARHGLPLNTRCGQRGLCDGCVIELKHGGVQHLDGGEVLDVGPGGEVRAFRACEHCIGEESELALAIPDRALMAIAPKVVDAFFIRTPRALQPVWSPPAGVFASGAAPFGVAIDVGTTTVALLLVDLRDGRIVARASTLNAQVQLGDNVLTRINLCCNDKSLVDALQEAVVNRTIAQLLVEALENAEASRDQIVCWCASGNTTMLHLLAGVDPSPLGVAPFSPVFTDYRTMALHELDFHWPVATAATTRDDSAPLDPSPQIHLLPGASGYIGSDITAGIVASGMLYDDGPVLLVDVGTNGEIVLKHNDHLLACATAAGPAFEGAKLVDGVRAGQGAIDHVRLTMEPFNVYCSVIGEAGDEAFDDRTASASARREVVEGSAGVHTPVLGICGSAYIDFLSEARRIGLLGPTGRFEAEAFPEAGERLASQAKCHGSCFRIAWGKAHMPIVISEADIAALLQAKAAIAAGMLTLLARVDMKPADVKRVYLAGGFGMHVNVASAIGCGLLPGFEVEQVELVGNTSLAGAYLALLDRDTIDEMTDAARRIEVVELNLEPQFESTYVDQL
ncbi:MAG: ASKHA domain-containing protein, partial [Rhodospirillales bacterium]|nr:ASKHA domain-containing protein [Rhodospirillales bacterium]